MVGDGLADVPVLLRRPGGVELLELEPGVDDGLQQVQRPEHVRRDGLVRPVPRLADVRLGAEVEDVRPIGRGVLQLANEVVDRRAVGEVREVDLEPVAQVADVVQRAARGRADERVHRRAELDERVRQVRAHEAVGARDENGAAVVDVPELAAEVVERGACPESVVRHGPYASASMSKRTDSSGLGSLGSAALTATSLIVVSGFAALVGVLIAREFGRTDETDGFFAAYGVFVVVVTAAQAIRVAVLPSLARAREARTARVARRPALRPRSRWSARRSSSSRCSPRIGSRTCSRETARRWRAKPARTRSSWVVPAAVAHLFIGLAASTFAALDDYATPAARVRGRQRCRPRLHRHAHGLGRDRRRVARDGRQRRGRRSLIPLVVLAWRAHRTSMPASAARPAGEPLRHRLGTVSRGGSHPALAPARVCRVAPVRRAPRLGCGDELRLRVPRRDDARRHHRVLDRARLVGAAVSHRAHPGCGRPARRRCDRGSRS